MNDPHHLGDYDLHAVMQIRLIDWLRWIIWTDLQLLYKPVDQVKGCPTNHSGDLLKGSSTLDIYDIYTG